MDSTRSDDLVERITREVLQSLASPQKPSARSTEATATAPTSIEPSCYCGGGTMRGGPAPFILAPDAIHFHESVVEDNRTIDNGYVRIGVSARHCHVTQQDLEILFGPGAKLTVYRDLLQPGEFAADQAVSVVGPRMRCVENVRILGPCRKFTQVELSLTDCIYLGVQPPVRPSGNHENTSGILMVGPKGSITLTRGVIRANRHIHLQTNDAQRLAVRDNDRVMVRIGGDRPVIYHDVQIRVNEKFIAEMHLDTDDANAVGVKSGDMAQIIRGYHECRVCETCGPKA